MLQIVMVTPVKTCFGFSRPQTHPLPLYPTVTNWITSPLHTKTKWSAIGYVTETSVTSVTMRPAFHSGATLDRL